MTTPHYAADLADKLARMIEKPPETVPVVALARPDQDVVGRRLDGLVGAVAELTGLQRKDMTTQRDTSRTVLRGPTGAVAVGFHASGAMSVKLGLAPFDQLFERDPGDDELTQQLERITERLGIGTLIAKDEQLTFERLWRIKAAGSEPGGKRTEPVLCRAVGAYRHHLHGLPVYGRASATVELSGTGELASMSTSVRRFADDDGGKIVAETKARPPAEAAAEIAAQLTKAFGRPDEVKDTELVAESFRFGYLSLGRRREQALLAPFYVATVAVNGAAEHSAHVLVATGSTEQYLRLPAGQQSSSTARPTAPTLEAV